MTSRVINGAGASVARPAISSERVTELDVLRGFALFGVFLANLVKPISWNLLATSEQMAALPSQSVDNVFIFLINVFIADKSNTLFAFLFGLGFYIQMDRLSKRGVNFTAIYSRRLFILLVFGFVHLIFIWFWDILHLYAFCGFFLLILRRASDRFLLVMGLFLALTGRLVVDLWLNMSGTLDSLGVPVLYESTAALERQAISQSGNYLSLLTNLFEINWKEYFLTGIVGWIFYVLGRFMIGIWVGRRGWLQNASQYLPGYRRVLWIALPTGLGIELVGQAIGWAISQHLLSGGVWEVLMSTCHMTATPFMATGYACLIVLGLRTGLGHRLLSPLAAVGKMALTNYVAQSFIIGFVLLGIGPGLNLAGQIGIAHLTYVAIIAFGGQILFSHLWLQHFAFGPLEWVWRGLTYGHFPPLVRADG